MYKVFQNWADIPQMPTDEDEEVQLVELDWTIQNSWITAANYDHCQGSTEVELIGSSKKITVPNCVSVASIESHCDDDDEQYFILKIKFPTPNYFGINEIQTVSTDREQLVKMAVYEITNFDDYIHMYDEPEPVERGM